jgi:hypothetical protein
MRALVCPDTSRREGRMSQIMPRALRLLVRILTCLGASALLCACVSVQLANSWKDPAFAGPPLRRVLVVGVTQSEVNRRLFEDTFARELGAAGPAAAASHTVLSDNGGIGRDEIRKAVEKAGADAVLVTRIVRAEKHVDLAPAAAMPPVGGRFYGWYGSAATMPVEQYTTITLESTLWDVKTEKIAWSATSGTFESQDVEKVTSKLAQVLIAKMRSDGVI